MTTIALNDGILAMDCQATAENIATNVIVKADLIDSVLYIGVGSIANTEILKNLIVNKEMSHHKHLCGSVLVIKSIDDIREYALGPLVRDSAEMRSVELPPRYAAGSGEKFAVSALDLGATAVQAVIVAANRDQNTNNRVISIDLNQDFTKLVLPVLVEPTYKLSKTGEVVQTNKIIKSKGVGFGFTNFDS